MDEGRPFITLRAEAAGLSVEMKLDEFADAVDTARAMGKFMVSAGFHVDNVRDAFSQVADEV